MIKARGVAPGILRYARAILIAERQTLLRWGNILLGRFTVLFHCLSGILRDALALLVIESQIKLILGNILLCGFADAFYGFPGFIPMPQQ